MKFNIYLWAASLFLVKCIKDSGVHTHTYKNHIYNNYCHHSPKQGATQMSSLGTMDE